MLWLRLDIDLLNRNYTSPANTLPYETLPGGTTNLHDQQDLTKNYDHAFLGFWTIFANTSLYDGGICFVPSYSALDVPTVTTATAYAKYVNGITDNPSTPRVARFIAQEPVSSSQFNAPHIRFTARNSEWVFNQMQQDLTKAAQVACSAACSAECSPTVTYSINGPTKLCAATSGTYSITNLPAGAQVQWSVSPSGQVSPGTGTGASFTISPTASFGAGYVTVSAQISGCGGPTTVSQRVDLGQGALAINDS